MNFSLQRKENPSTVRSIWWSLCTHKTEEEDEDYSEYKRGWTAQESAVVARMEQNLDRTDSIKVDFEELERKLGQRSRRWT